MVWLHYRRGCCKTCTQKLNHRRTFFNRRSNLHSGHVNLPGKWKFLRQRKKIRVSINSLTPDFFKFGFFSIMMFENISDISKKKRFDCLLVSHFSGPGSGNTIFSWPYPTTLDTASGTCIIMVLTLGTASASHTYCLCVSMMQCSRDMLLIIYTSNKC